MSTLPHDWRKNFEESIRSGRHESVRSALEHVRRQTVDRKDVVDLAVFARRLGLLEVGLRILEPIVRPEYPLKEEATPLELATYASVLARIGALDVAQALLSSLRNHDLPEVDLYLAHVAMFRWNYQASIGPLKRYLRRPNVSEYEVMTASMNLAASYQATGKNEREMKVLLESVLDRTKANGWTRHYRNALELRAQIALSDGEWDLVEKCLVEAETLSGDDYLPIQKWRAILEFKRSKASPSSLAQLTSIRGDAEAAGDWETVRDCDRYLALGTRDENLAAKVYFGTAYATFRRKLQRESAQWLKLPTTYVWGKGSRVFDLSTGKEIDGTAMLKVGQVLLRLLQFLASDFYRSFPIGEVFHAVYPNEHFNSVSSPPRVRRLVERLREWFDENDVPLEISIDGNHMRLRFTGEYALQLPKANLTSPERALASELLNQLRARWPYQSFSASQAAVLLELPIERTRKVLSEAVDKKKLRTEGRGRATRFRFSK